MTTIRTELTEAILQAVAEHPREQPEGLAKIVADATDDPVVMKAFLVELLTARVKDLVRMEGNALRSEVLDGPTNRPANWSPRFADRRTAWIAMLDSRININGDLKRLGALTRGELVECVQKRRALVEQIERQIQHFESLIEMLDTHQVATLDECPPQE